MSNGRNPSPETYTNIDTFCDVLMGIGSNPAERRKEHNYRFRLKTSDNQNVDVNIKFQPETFNPHVEAKITYQLPPDVKLDANLRQQLNSLNTRVKEDFEPYQHATSAIEQAAPAAVARPASRVSTPTQASNGLRSLWQFLGTITPNIPRITNPSVRDTNYDPLSATLLASRAMEKLTPGIYNNNAVESRYCVIVQVSSIDTLSNKVFYSFGVMQKTPKDTTKYPHANNDVVGYEEGLTQSMSFMKSKGIFQELKQSQSMLPISSSSFPPSNPEGDALYVNRIKAFLKQATLNKIESPIILSPQDKKHLGEIIQRARDPQVLADAKFINQMSVMTPREEVEQSQSISPSRPRF